MPAFNLNKFAVAQREKIEKGYQQTLSHADDFVLGILLLNTFDFRTGPIDNWDAVYGKTFVVEDRLDFCKVHKALGTLVQSGIEPEGDGRTRKVRVHLRPKDKQFHNMFQFSYVKTLPKPDKRKGKEGQPKCRLVTRTVKRTVLVCDKE